MKYLSIQESCREKLTSFFCNNFNDFEGLAEDKIKAIMIYTAIKELSISAEEIYEYVEEIDVAIFNKRMYN